MAAVGDYRSVVAVPILRNGLAIGSIAVARAEAGLLPDPEVELLKTFADQAAIAIENARLLNELRESLEQQTATSEVLRVISSSPGELEPVFQTMLANAVQLCDAKLGSLFLLSGDTFRVVATHGTAAAFVTGSHVLSEHPHNPLTRVADTKQVLHITDVAGIH
jgi:transcriptional regulator with GAF, ATPase, and Fis domain